MSGVLPEAAWEGSRPRGAILGIGVNIRVNFDDRELRNSAISLEDVVERRLDRCELIAMLLRRIDHWYSLINSPGLVSNWKRRLSTLNQRVAIDGLRGVALDATPDGALVIRDEEGHIHQIRTDALSENVVEVTR